MAAAVADYRPSEPIEGKRAKTEAGWKIELEPTVDVLAALGEQERHGQVLVGFGAEAGEDGLDRKRRMLTDKNLDLVVYNDVSVSGIGFDASDNAVTLLTHAGERELPRASKDEIAAGIVDEVERLLEERRGGS
jgi:phosphopantothenoylcysteine decarboxylase/phosphopantothenate--cysteine ligase